MKTAKNLLLALAILPLQSIQAHNGLYIEKKPLKTYKIGLKLESESLIVVTDPIAESINIRFMAVKDETYVVHLINETGNEVARQYRFLGEGENSIEIRTLNIPDGTYHVKIDNEYQSEMAKLQVQK
jgi:hypothetical protein